MVSKLQLQYVPIQLAAQSAGSFRMSLVGKLSKPLTLTLADISKPATIILKDVVVIKNLGQDILLGEPGKEDNCVVTYPSTKTIQFQSCEGRTLKLPYHSKKGVPLRDFVPLQSEKKMLVHPNDTISLKVPDIVQGSIMQVVTRRDSGFEVATISKVNDVVQLKNNSSQPIIVPKLSHVADLRSCYLIDMGINADEKIAKLIYDIRYMI